MAEKDVVVTYETLFELLRLEKNREDLQKLEDSFFDDVLRYINEKRAKFESKESQSMLFATDEKEKARLELENIKKILKELYDKREKKIVSNALNTARAGMNHVNTSNMLASEKMLFNSVSSMLCGFRKNILFKIANCESPDLSAISERLSSDLDNSLIGGIKPSECSDDNARSCSGMGSQPVEYSGVQKTASSEPVDSSTFHDSLADEPKELKTSPDFGDSGANTKKIRFLAPVGEIVGPDLEIYGPYEEGTVISLPEELASVLLEKKQAEKVAN
jgi:DNA replication initiation complex subunit (GINS family)